MAKVRGIQRDTKLFWGLLTFRILNAILTSTFFQADEFWQALEPAHLKAFGYGELTWEWRHGLRSYAFPLIFEIGYRFVKIVVKALNFCQRLKLSSSVSIDHQQDLSYSSDLLLTAVEYYGVLYVPKIIMGTIAAIGEYYMIKWIRSIALSVMDKENDAKQPRAAAEVTRVATILSLSNFFNFFLITRSFINSFEMCLTCVALFYWDWSGGDAIITHDFTKSITIAVFTCLQRPSNVLIWLVLGGFLILNLLYTGKTRKLGYLFYKIGLVLIATILFNATIDYYFYGEMVFPLLKFMTFNFTTPLSNFYGIAPWHFHLFQSLPLMLGYSIPIFVYGLLFRLFRKRFVRYWSNPLFQTKTVIIINLFVYSLLPHKEFRFIYPLQPFFIMVTAISASKIASDLKINEKKYKGVMWIIPIFSILAAFLLCTRHEGGTVAVIKMLHQQPHIDSVGFIMPCHSTPWQSYLHRNDIKSLWSITCDPPLHLLGDPNAYEKLPHYEDESDHLYADVAEFLDKNFPKLSGEFNKDLHKYEWPEYLVIFEHLDNVYMKSFLEGSSYQPSQRFFNSLAHWDSRRQGDVIVYKKKDL